jgi:hypothetical protein
MKVSNKHVYSDNQDWLSTIREEYTQMGFDTDLTSGHLTVYTIRRKSVKAKAGDKPTRNKRAESHVRDN